MQEGNKSKISMFWSNQTNSLHILKTKTKSLTSEAEMMTTSMITILEIINSKIIDKETSKKQKS